MESQSSSSILIPSIKIVPLVGSYNLANKEKTVVLIHDIDGLRYQREEFAKLEMSKLKLFKYMIVHNDNMKKYLEEQGIEAKLISLDVFDYLCDGEVKENRKTIKTVNDCTLVYAGNLTKEKSPFLHQLEKDKIKFKFNVYGTGTALEDLREIVDYKGKYPPDELPNLLEGNLGVVWDGAFNDEDETFCLKNYTKYNNPHKFSMYLASNMPIIIWKKAALADFVFQNNIGIVIESLEDIGDCLNAIS